MTDQLVYEDDTYDKTTGIYREARPSDVKTYASHYLNIAGNSKISYLSLSCVDPHNCNLGIQYPTKITALAVSPAVPSAQGRITIRGYIDPFVDEMTDYYHDSFVKSYPDFNLETFDLDFAKPIVEYIYTNEGYVLFDVFTSYLASMANFNLYDYERTVNQFLNTVLPGIDFKADMPVAFLRRGHIDEMLIDN